MSRRIFLCLVLVLAMLVVGTPVLSSSTFPTREIRLIVPWSPGGSTDILARGMQPIFKEKFGANLVILNRPGGGSAVGLTEVMTSKPDGYTLGLASTSIMFLMARGEVTWTMDRLCNIALVSEEPIMLLAKSGGRFKTLADFMDYVAKNPGKVTVGTPGRGLLNDMFAVLAARSVGSEVRIVPFEAGSNTVAALMGGHVDAAALKPSETISQIKAGEICALGVFGTERARVLPSVPTFAESGYDILKGSVLAQVGFVVGPAGIPKDIQEKLAYMFREAVESAEFQRLGESVGFVPKSLTGPELDSLVSRLYASVSKLAREISGE